MDLLTVSEYAKLRGVNYNPVKKTIERGKMPLGVKFIAQTFGGMYILSVDDAENLPKNQKKGKARGNPNFHLLSPYSKGKKGKDGGESNAT